MTSSIESYQVFVNTLRDVMLKYGLIIKNNVVADVLVAADPFK